LLLLVFPCLTPCHHHHHHFLLSFLFSFSFLNPPTTSPTPITYNIFFFLSVFFFFFSTCSTSLISNQTLLFFCSFILRRNLASERITPITFNIFFFPYFFFSFSSCSTSLIRLFFFCSFFLRRNLASERITESDLFFLILSFSGCAALQSPGPGSKGLHHFFSSSNLSRSPARHSLSALHSLATGYSSHSLTFSTALPLSLPATSQLLSPSLLRRSLSLCCFDPLC
jgi:hypothetical protein